MEQDKYLIVLEKSTTGFSAYSPDVPGCVATGDTIEATLNAMQNSLHFHLQNIIEDGEELPLPRGLDAYLEAIHQSEGEEYFLTYVPVPSDLVVESSFSLA